MPLLKGSLPIAVSLGIMAAVTAILWYINRAAATPHHLVYFYLLPVVLVAILYSGRLAMACAILALVAADYFLQDPLYSLYNTDPLEYGDLICFGILAAMTIKCTRELMRPGAKIPAAGSRYRRF